MNMFCYQCEQTYGGRGCDKLGVCGKDPKVAALQDLLVYAAKGISQYANKARQHGAKEQEIDVFVVEALFTTGTNVNFDADRLETLLRKAAIVQKRARALYEEACRRVGQVPEKLEGPAQWTPAATLDGLAEQASHIGIAPARAVLGDDLAGLQELLTYGLKGVAAYADHARIQGKEDEKVYAFIHEAMDYLTQSGPTVDKLFALSMKCGEINLAVMEMLDSAHTGAYGNPVPTSVRITPVKGKAILVPAMTLKIWNHSSIRRRDWASTSTLMVKCCLHTVIRVSRSMPILLEITAAHGRIRQKILMHFRAPFS